MPEHRDTLHEAIHAANDAEDWGAVVELANRHEDKVRSSFELSWNVGWACYKLANLAQATDYLRRAVEIEPENAIGLWALGVAFAEQGLSAEAEHALQRSIALRDSQVARLALAVLYMSTGRVAEAEHIHREGVLLQPQHRERLEGLANFLSDTGRDAEADELYQKAKQLPSREERRRHRDAK